MAFPFEQQEPGDSASSFQLAPPDIRAEYIFLLTSDYIEEQQNSKEIAAVCALMGGALSANEFSHVLPPALSRIGMCLGGLGAACLSVAMLKERQRFQQSVNSVS